MNKESTFKIICPVQCTDELTHIPYSFIDRCKFLKQQEDCKDFKNIYQVTKTTKEIYEAYDLHENRRYNDIMFYDKTLDYLGYKNICPSDFDEKFNLFCKLLKYDNEPLCFDRYIDLKDITNKELFETFYYLNKYNIHLQLLLTDEIAKYNDQAENIIFNYKYTENKLDTIDNNKGKMLDIPSCSVTMDKFKFLNSEDKTPKHIIVGLQIQIEKLGKWKIN
jgi:hypothetical protein